MVRQRNKGSNTQKHLQQSDNNQNHIKRPYNVVSNCVKFQKSSYWIKASVLTIAVFLLPIILRLLIFHSGFLKMFKKLEDQNEAIKPHIFVETHQNVSLHHPYSVDYAELIRVRRENMKKYNYRYDLFGVDKRSNLSLQEFRDVYDGKWPVVVTDIVPQWKASNWTGKFFSKHYGDERTTMKACSKGLGSAETLALPLKLFYKNVEKAFPNTWTYIEDELFIPMRPELRSQIGENPYMEEDYFNIFPKEVRPWNCMLLWGTKYSRSSLHIDPYNWTGTNAVFVGRKRWRLYPPGQDFHLYVREGITSGFPLNCFKYNSVVDAYSPDFKAFPLFKKATAIEFDQLPGEILFIPTGWFHQAFNVEETIAVSSQITNRNNFRVVLEEVLKVGNVNRKDLPKNIDSLSPPDQVKNIMSLLPKHLLERGEAVTEDIINQVQSLEKKAPRQRP